MDKRISDILQDLYAIDPQLKTREKELIALVSDLVTLKPDTHFDTRFATELRAELVRKNTRPVSSPYASIFISRTFYGVVASALTLLIAVPFTFVATQKAVSPNKPIVFNPFSNQVKNSTSGLSPKQQISNKGTNAFGTLAFVATTTDSTRGSTNVGTSTNASSSEALGVAGSSTSPSVKNLTETYTYEYKGDSITLQNNDGKVFKRMKGIDSNRQLSELIQYSKFSLTDLSTFNDLNLENIVISEDKPFGYTVGINFDEGSVSINPAASYWSKATTSAAMPNNSALISIADAFIKLHGINTSIYSTPIVLPSAANATVIYPLIIDGKTVYEANGTPFGLTITIDVSQQKVSNVQNLTSQIYDSSLYTLETNFPAILKVATSTLTGPAKKTAPTQRAFLGTPQQVLMHYWSNNVELYAPALSFPITYGDTASTTLSKPSTIVVPLVKDFLGKVNQ